LLTHLAPLDLLNELQRIENESGRVRLRHWGERTLDLDLLLYAEKNIINERLTVPHVGILQRDFVVIPLLDLDTELKVNGQSLQNLELVQHSTLTVLADQSWAG
jgi:2-amino-4-hydroxy-6-hydroxymethyldihydropteridine diphosphokinase